MFFYAAFASFLFALYNSYIRDILRDVGVGCTTYRLFVLVRLCVEVPYLGSYCIVTSQYYVAKKETYRYRSGAVHEYGTGKISIRPGTARMGDEGCRRIDAMVFTHRGLLRFVCRWLL